MPVRIKGNEKRAYDLYQFKKEYGIDDFLFSGLVDVAACKPENCENWKELLGRLKGKRDAAAKIFGTDDEQYQEMDAVVHALKVNHKYRENVLKSYKQFRKREKGQNL